MNKWDTIILVSWFLPHHSFKKEMVNRNGAGRGFPIGVWCHSWVLCWIFAGWRRMYVQMARVLKAWHLTNSMCRMERRQSMVTPGAKSIHASTEALQFGYLHQVAIRNRSAIQKNRTKSHREFALCFLFFSLLHTIDITTLCCIEKIIGPLEDR